METCTCMQFMRRENLEMHGQSVPMGGESHITNWAKQRTGIMSKIWDHGRVAEAPSGRDFGRDLRVQRCSSINPVTDPMLLHHPALRLEGIEVLSWSNSRAVIVIPFNATEGLMRCPIFITFSRPVATNASARL